MIVRCLSHAFIAPLFKATQVNSKKMGFLFTGFSLCLIIG